MRRIIMIACALWTTIAGLLWTLAQIASGWSIPGWVPATGMLAAGVALILLIVA